MQPDPDRTFAGVNAPSAQSIGREAGGLYRWLYARLIYPAYHGILRDGATAATRALLSHDSLGIDAFDAVCREKLSRLLQQAAAHVPYYREKISAAGMDPAREGAEALLSALPPLTKETIRAEGRRLVSEQLDGNRLYPNSTSGSTGSPLDFFTDERSLAWRKATVTRNRRWLGVALGDSVASLWGSPIDNARAKALRGRINALVTREKLFSAYALSDDDMGRYANALARHRPRLLTAYPSVMVEFARFCAERSIEFPSLIGIVCSAEALHPPQRKFIEERVRVPVYNRYGCREVGDIAQEAPGYNGLLVNADRVYVEIVDEDGLPCGPGELGHILVTDLDNFGMPLIRYRIGDLGVWGRRDVGANGLPYPVLDRVEGRSLDVVRTADGRRIGGTFWTILFRQKPGIALFQVVQSELAGVRVRYVMDPSVTRIDKAFFAERIRAYAGPDFGVEFEEVERIDAEPNGKYRIVVGLSESEISDGAFRE